MAKVKLDWFKLDCQMDDKIELIEAEFGLTGFAVVVKLFQKIYGSEGYYCEWNSDVALVFARKNGVGANVVSEIISASIRRGIFDERMLNEFGILTSHGIQSRYFDSEAIQRRKLENLKPEYLLVKCALKNRNADISGKNEDIISKNEDIFSQRREEEKREEKNREDKRRGEKKREKPQNADISSPAPPAQLTPRNFLNITDEAYKHLCDSYTSAVVDDYINRVYTYSREKNKHYADNALIVKKWIDEDIARGRLVITKSNYDLDAWEDFAASFDPTMLMEDDEGGKKHQ